jgi:DNA-binding NtrC family response regulator
VRVENAVHYLADNPSDLAIVDIYLGAENGIEALDRLRAAQPDLYALIMTAHIGVETAALAMTKGSVDYVSKPLRIEQIRAILSRVAAYRRSSPAAPAAEPAPAPAESAIVGRSMKMLEVYKAIGQVAASNVNVLITGESGTGKELVARAIHKHSKRTHAPFMAVNCGSVTETILESEFFGHEKGAFTGANDVRKGLLEATDGGTVFLDEITETSLAFQVKLLRVIEEQRVRRVGSNKYTAVDVRFLASSNRHVPALIQTGHFREDLYYRLRVVEIAMPPLRERREDLPLLVAHFLARFNRRHDRVISIEPAAVALLQAMHWPGNVRELENTLYRMAIFCRMNQITMQDVQAEANRGTIHSAEEARSMPDRLMDLERQHIVRMLKQTSGNKSEAARRLGIERKTLYKKALRLGIDLQSTSE